MGNAPFDTDTMKSDTATIGTSSAVAQATLTEIAVLSLALSVGIVGGVLAVLHASVALSFLVGSTGAYLGVSVFHRMRAAHRDHRHHRKSRHSGTDTDYEV